MPFTDSIKLHFDVHIFLKATEFHWLFLDFRPDGLGPVSREWTHDRTQVGGVSRSLAESSQIAISIFIQHPYTIIGSQMVFLLFQITFGEGKCFCERGPEYP